MISKLPRWAWLGAAALATIAGTINAVGFLGFQHQGVTAPRRAFLAGCVVSGAITQDSTLQLGRRYGVALTAEAGLLFAAVRV